jgi:hypothetical protein
MAESAFDFNQAPSGSPRQFGVLAGALGLKASKMRSSGGNSLSARDQAALSAQSHAQNLELESHKGNIAQQNATMSSVVGHVVGEEAATAAHRRILAQNRQQNRLAASESAANRAHELEKQSQAHTQATDMHVLGMNSINTLAENKSVGSFKLPNGTSAQFNGVGETQA